ncbi:MAG: 3-hydroxyacyl-CoA dehydrogenase [Gemmatimonadetes bacterium]|nr:3-hydroxyacyl-CoA dehydrogenase [Gemmatimonadota bacterium]
MPAIAAVSVVGTGVIGRSWIQVFARAGCRTRVYDPDPAQVEKALAWLDEDLEASVADGLVRPRAATALRTRVSPHAKLAEALRGAGYVQESGPENLAIKRGLFADLDRTAGADAILASSTSAINMTEIAEGLAGRRRCIVAHPTNPPHVVPAVEVLPGRDTDAAVVERTIEFLRRVGQTPVVLKKYALGFALNRLQAALVREAIHLVEDGVADVAAVDALVRDGLGLRWALLGPFGVGHTNADGGIREYYTKYGRAYLGLMGALRNDPPAFDSAMIERIARETEAREGPASRVPEILRWRDRLIGKIRALREQDPHPYVRSKK